MAVNLELESEECGRDLVSENARQQQRSGIRSWLDLSSRCHETRPLIP